MSKILELSATQPPQIRSRLGRFFHWFNTLKGRRTITGYLFVAPFILGVLLWVVYPAGMAAWLAFQKWNLITPAKYVGLENFRTMYNDSLFWQALKVTSIFTFVSVPLGLIISFSTALLLNTKVRGLAI